MRASDYKKENLKVCIKKSNLLEKKKEPKMSLLFCCPQSPKSAGSKKTRFVDCSRGTDGNRKSGTLVKKARLFPLPPFVALFSSAFPYPPSTLPLQALTPIDTTAAPSRIITQTTPTPRRRP